MKKINLFLAVFVIAILLSITVLSQLGYIVKPGPIVDVETTKSQVTDTIVLEKKETCTTELYDEVQDVYSTCVYYNNYTDCLNTSGLNTACSPKQDTYSFQCKTGEKTVQKSRTECKPNDEFIISIDKGTVALKKQIDFSDFGPCIYEEENNCLIITCQSKYDGANDGKFHGCKSGTSCQKFEICDNSIKTLYKNSREDYAEEDSSFFLDKLSLKEVEE
jgi:hypothetical protein